MRLLLFRGPCRSVAAANLSSLGASVPKVSHKDEFKHITNSEKDALRLRVENASMPLALYWCDGRRNHIELARFVDLPLRRSDLRKTTRILGSLAAQDSTLFMS